jgi:hypothetical protein
VVFLFGATGDQASVKLAKNTSDTFSSKTLGIVKNDIAAGASGIIITQGVVDKLNTAAYSSGDILWLDSIAGQMTKIKPVAPKHEVFVGVVERANAGNGQIYVKPQNGYELGELHNVSVNNERQNAVFYYDSTNRLWKAQSVYGLVDTTAFQRKQLPAYSFIANGTNAAANGTATYFEDTSGTYTGSITWTAGTQPSGATNHSYRWTRIGKMVTLTISLVYATNALTATQVIVTLPSDAPTPLQPAGLTSASNGLYAALVATQQNATAAPLANTGRALLRNNAANNGFEIVAAFSASTIVNTFIQVQYTAQ